MMEKSIFFEFNDTYECLELEAINNSTLISDSIKQMCQDKFNKDCYFSYGTSTKIGKLIGIEINIKTNEVCYILKGHKDKYYISCKDTMLKKL